MSSINFYKMEGAGNDFVVIDNRDTGLSMDEIIAFTPDLCDRKFGVGADGVLVLDTAATNEADYTMIYRNADGSDAGMCGNGSRCLAMYAAHHGFGNEQTFNVHAAHYRAVVDKIEQEVHVDFPDVMAPKKLQIGKKRYLQVYTGTEHIVSFEELERLEEEDDLLREGQFIRNHPVLDPPGTNVNFICMNEPYSLYLQTYERGVEDLTLACGTGAIASAIAAHFIEESEPEAFEYTVKVKGGILKVSFQFDEETNTYTNITLSGPAHFVFEGTIDI